MRAGISQADDSVSGDEHLGHFGQLEWQRRQKYDGENSPRRFRRYGGDRSNTPSETADESRLAALDTLSGQELLRVGSPLSDAHSGESLPPPPLRDAHAAADDRSSSGTPSRAAQWRRIDAAAAAADDSNTLSRPHANRPRSPPPLPPQPVGGSPTACYRPGRTSHPLPPELSRLSSREIFAAFRTPGSRHPVLT